MSTQTETTTTTEDPVIAAAVPLGITLLELFIKFGIPLGLKFWDAVAGITSPEQVTPELKASLMAMVSTPYDDFVTKKVTTVTTT